LYLSHKAVHAGFEPAPRHSSLYANERILNHVTRGQGEPEWLVRKRTQSRHGLDKLYGGEFTLESLYRQYARTLAALDESVGRVLNAVKDDTLVVYMGDNGFLLGEHGLVDKRVMYEPSIRVPMLMRCPELFAGRRTLDPMALNIDVAPTLLEAAGLRAPRTMHGRSLLPLLIGRNPEWRKEFVYEYFWEWEAMHTPGILGLRTERHSLMEYEGVWDTNELHDLQSDPGQLRNLLTGTRVDTEPGGWLRKVRDPELRALALDLRKRMARILRTTGGEALVHGPLA
jgi:N-acetylglucosamine-6-sulfatase